MTDPEMPIGHVTATWCEGCGPHENVHCSECGEPVRCDVVVDDEMIERAAKEACRQRFGRAPHGGEDGLGYWRAWDESTRQRVRDEVRPLIVAALSREEG